MNVFPRPTPKKPGKDSRAGPRHAPFFFADPAAMQTDEILIEGADAHHLAVVRRAQPGDAVRIGDGQGRIVEARLLSVKPAGVETEVVSETRSPAPRPAVEIYQGLARGDKVDDAVRRLVEIGVDAIVVFEAGRSVARWDPKRAAAAGARWSAIAREAAKQSHRAWLPRLIGPVPLTEAAATAGRSPPGLGLVGQPGATQRLGAVLAAAAAAQHPPAKVWVVIGPEGGLSPAEVDTFVAAGATPVSLGDQILRTETASVVTGALVMHHFARLG